MMFGCCIAISLVLLALTSGVALLIWGYRNQGKAVGLARVFGYIVTIIASISLACTLVCCFKGHGRYFKPGARRGMAPMMKLRPGQPRAQ